MVGSVSVGSIGSKPKFDPNLALALGVTLVSTLKEYSWSGASVAFLVWADGDRRTDFMGAGVVNTVGEINVKL